MLRAFERCCVLLLRGLLISFYIIPLVYACAGYIQASSSCKPYLWRYFLGVIINQLAATGAFLPAANGMMCNSEKRVANRDFCLVVLPLLISFAILCLMIGTSPTIFYDLPCPTHLADYTFFSVAAHFAFDVVVLMMMVGCGWVRKNPPNRPISTDSEPDETLNLHWEYDGIEIDNKRSPFAPFDVCTMIHLASGPREDVILKRVDQSSFLLVDHNDIFSLVSIPKRGALLHYEITAPVKAAEMLPWGRLVTGDALGAITLYHVTGQIIQKLCGHSESVVSICRVGNGRFVSTSIGELKLWSFEGECLRSWQTVKMIKLSRINDAWLMHHEDTNKIGLWDFQKDRHQDTPYSGLIAPLKDSELIVVSGKVISLWDITSTIERKRFAGHSHPVVSLCALTDRLFASCSRIGILIWDIEREHYIQHLDAFGGVEQLHGFYPVLLALNSRTITLWK